MGAACRDCSDWCADWAPRQIHQPMRVTAEMAPQGLRNLACDLCRASWGSTLELRHVVRGACERPSARLMECDRR
eukprot:597494-Pyramimonas_sp.AAC.1